MFFFLLVIFLPIFNKFSWKPGLHFFKSTKQEVHVKELLKNTTVQNYSGNLIIRIPWEWIKSLNSGYSNYKNGYNRIYDSLTECALCLQQASLPVPCLMLLSVSVQYCYWHLIVSASSLLAHWSAFLRQWLAVFAAWEMHVVLLWCLMGWYRLQIKWIESERLGNTSQILTKPKRKK